MIILDTSNVKRKLTRCTFNGAPAYKWVSPASPDVVGGNEWFIMRAISMPGKWVYMRRDDNVSSVGFPSLEAAADHLMSFFAEQD